MLISICSNGFWHQRSTAWDIILKWKLHRNSQWASGEIGAWTFGTEGIDKVYTLKVFSPHPSSQKESRVIWIIYRVLQICAKYTFSHEQYSIRRFATPPNGIGPDSTSKRQTDGRFWKCVNFRHFFLTIFPGHPVYKLYRFSAASSLVGPAGRTNLTLNRFVMI